MLLQARQAFPSMLAKSTWTNYIGLARRLEEWETTQDLRHDLWAEATWLGFLPKRSEGCVAGSRAEACC